MEHSRRGRRFRIRCSRGSIMRWPSSRTSGSSDAVHERNGLLSHETSQASRRSKRTRGHSRRSRLSYRSPQGGLSPFLQTWGRYSAFLEHVPFLPVSTNQKNLSLRRVAAKPLRTGDGRYPDCPRFHRPEVRVLVAASKGSRIPPSSEGVCPSLGRRAGLIRGQCSR